MYYLSERNIKMKIMHYIVFNVKCLQTVEVPSQ